MAYLADTRRRELDVDGSGQVSVSNDACGGGENPGSKGEEGGRRELRGWEGWTHCRLVLWER